MTTGPTASSLAAKAYGLGATDVGDGAVRDGSGYDGDEHGDRHSRRGRAERDFAYTSGAERALKKADTSGWTVVSMKDDFATVFAAADREDATAARPAVKAV